MIPEAEWKWFGNAGHFVCGNWCRFHLCTLVGNRLVSTVGQYYPDSQVREILAKSRNVELSGKGDARDADYMKKIGYEEIGYHRMFETMVFDTTGEVCTDIECACGLPKIIPTDIDFDAYNTAGDAAAGHMAMCKKWANQ